MKGFERFTPPASPQGVFLRVQTSGTLNFSSRLGVALGRPTHVVLLSDPDTGRIGIQVATPDDADAYPVRRYEHLGAGGQISALLFMRHVGVDLDAARGRYHCEIPEPGVAVTVQPLPRLTPEGAA